MTASPTYLKCACEHCAGRIEFPADAAGVTVDCPHCGAKTILTAPVQSTPPRRIRKRVVLPIAFALVASALFLILIARPRSLVVKELKLERATTNGAGSVTGVVENKSSRAKQGVRVEIDLLNSRGEKLWRATDYAPEISARGNWHFRALVLDANVKTAKVARVETR